MGITSAIAAVIGAGMSIKQGIDASNAQDKAQKQAKANARQADEAFGRGHQKSPDTNAILAAAQQAGKGGAGSTMLTGPQGVDPGSLSLGKTTLLGQ